MCFLILHYVGRIKWALVRGRQPNTNIERKTQMMCARGVFLFPPVQSYVSFHSSFRSASQFIRCSVCKCAVFFRKKNFLKWCFLSLSNSFCLSFQLSHCLLFDCITNDDGWYYALRSLDWFSYHFFFCCFASLLHFFVRVLLLIICLFLFHMVYAFATMQISIDVWLFIRWKRSKKTTLGTSIGV